MGRFWSRSSLLNLINFSQLKYILRSVMKTTDDTDEIIQIRVDSCSNLLALDLDSDSRCPDLHMFRGRPKIAHVQKIRMVFMCKTFGEECNCLLGNYSTLQIIN